MLLRPYPQEGQLIALVQRAHHPGGLQRQLRHQGGVVLGVLCRQVGLDGDALGVHDEHALHALVRLDPLQRFFHLTRHLTVKLLKLQLLKLLLK